MKFFLFLFMISSAQAEFIYRATTKINNRIFEDIIIIDQFPLQQGPLTGSLTVPGIFSSPLLETSNLRVYLWSDHYQMRLDVAVTENNQTTLIHYNLQSKTTGYLQLKGQLINEKDEVIGEVLEMRLIYESHL